jgi:hypothetical protein
MSATWRKERSTVETNEIIKTAAHRSESWCWRQLLSFLSHVLMLVLTQLVCGRPYTFTFDTTCFGPKWASSGVLLCSNCYTALILSIDHICDCTFHDLKRHNRSQLVCAKIVRGVAVSIFASYSDHSLLSTRSYICVLLRISPLLGNGSVNTFPKLRSQQ